MFSSVRNWKSFKIILQADFFNSKKDSFLSLFAAYRRFTASEITVLSILLFSPTVPKIISPICTPMPILYCGPLSTVSVFTVVSLQFLKHIGSCLNSILRVSWKQGYDCIADILVYEAVMPSYNRSHYFEIGINESEIFFRSHMIWYCHLTV